MIKNLKRNTVIAALTAAAMSWSFTTPSFATDLETVTASGRASMSEDSYTTESRGRVNAFRVRIPVTVTKLPKILSSSYGGLGGTKCKVYQLAANATKLPATQPTTGGLETELVFGVDVDKNFECGFTYENRTLEKHQRRFAVYNSEGVGVFVRTTFTKGGVGTATVSAPLTLSYLPERSIVEFGRREVVIAVPIIITHAPDGSENAHEDTYGARCFVYQLFATATKLPAVRPTTGLLRSAVVVDEDRSIDETKCEFYYRPGVLKTHVAKFAIYPNDGAGVFVTVKFRKSNSGQSNSGQSSSSQSSSGKVTHSPLLVTRYNGELDPDV